MNIKDTYFTQRYKDDLENVISYGIIKPDGYDDYLLNVDVDGDFFELDELEATAMINRLNIFIEFVNTQ